jgi:hypothetical protein
MEAWDFITAGGGLYNNLDYSFTVAHPGGTWTELPPTMPGGGSPSFRKQLRLLQDFISGFDFIRMKPDNQVILSGTPATMTARALAERGKAYAIYVRTIPLTNQFSARWTGFITPRDSGDYTFHLSSKERARLWVDDRQIIDNWKDHPETEDRGAIKLEKGRRYPIRIEYFYRRSPGVVKLAWARDSQPKTPIPAGVLMPSDGKGKGLKGEFFAEQSTGPKMERLLFSRVDTAVEFEWDQNSLATSAQIQRGLTLALDLPAGCYKAEWIDAKSGEFIKQGNFKHGAGAWAAKFPDFKDDIALRLKACR